MFRTLTRLIFGGEETPEDVKPREEVEEGWLVVNHQEAASLENQNVENQSVQEPTQTLNAAFSADTDTTLESDNSVVEPETTIQSDSAVSGFALQPKALDEVTQLTCVQKAKSWADRHHVSRNAILRQNRIRQGVVHHHSCHLQQPGPRNLSH